MSARHPELDRAINLSPSHVPSFNLRGLAYAAIGDTKRPIQDFDQASHLDDHSAEAFLNRGNILPGTNQVERALADDSDVRLKPKDAYSLLSTVGG